MAPTGWTSTLVILVATLTVGDRTEALGSPWAPNPPIYSQVLKAREDTQPAQTSPQPWSTPPVGLSASGCGMDTGVLETLPVLPAHLDTVHPCGADPLVCPESAHPEWTSQTVSMESFPRILQEGPQHSPPGPAEGRPSPRRGFAKDREISPPFCQKSSACAAVMWPGAQGTGHSRDKAGEGWHPDLGEYWGDSLGGAVGPLVGYFLCRGVEGGGGPTIISILASKREKRHQQKAS